MDVKVLKSHPFLEHGSSCHRVHFSLRLKSYNHISNLVFGLLSWHFSQKYLIFLLLAVEVQDQTFGFIIFILIIGERYL